MKSRAYTAVEEPPTRTNLTNWASVSSRRSLCGTTDVLTSCIGRRAGSPTASVVSGRRRSRDGQVTTVLSKDGEAGSRLLHAVRLVIGGNARSPLRFGFFSIPVGGRDRSPVGVAGAATG